jgi:predicted small secreted protein
MHLIKLLAVLLVAGSLAACNTMEGAGEDIERAGEAIRDKADDDDDADD